MYVKYRVNTCSQRLANCNNVKRNNVRMSPFKHGSNLDLRFSLYELTLGNDMFPMFTVFPSKIISTITEVVVLNNVTRGAVVARVGSARVNIQLEWRETLSNNTLQLYIKLKEI